MPVRLTSPFWASISIREPARVRLARSTLATESAVVWFGLAAVLLPECDRGRQGEKTDRG